MKKIILILALLIVVPPYASAQKWLKSVGRVLEKVDKYLDSSSSSSSPSKASAEKSSSQKPQSKGDQTPANSDTGFPEKGQWHTKTTDGLDVIIDINTAAKTFSYFDEPNYGFIVTNSYERQVNTIEEVKVTANKSRIKFINFRDYNTYGITLTYNPADGTLTISELELIEKNPDFMKYYLNLPYEELTLRRATSPLTYSTDQYE